MRVYQKRVYILNDEFAADNGRRGEHRVRISRFRNSVLVDAFCGTKSCQVELSLAEFAEHLLKLGKKHPTRDINL